MIKILFFTALVCICCMSASGWLYGIEDDDEGFPDLKNCTKNAKNLEEFCAGPATSAHWNLTDYFKNRQNQSIEIDAHLNKLLCCFTWDASACYIREMPFAYTTCTHSQQKAYLDFIEKWDSYLETHECVNVTRKSDECKI